MHLYDIMGAPSSSSNRKYSADNFSLINRLNLTNNSNLLNHARPLIMPNQSLICRDYNQPDYSVHECNCRKPFTSMQPLGGHKRFLPEINNGESSNEGNKKLRFIDDERRFEVVHGNQMNMTPSDYKGKSPLITEDVDPRRLHVQYNHLTERIHLGRVSDSDTLFAPKPIRAHPVGSYNQLFTEPIYQNYLPCEGPTLNSKIPILDSSSSRVPPPPPPSPVNWKNSLPARVPNREEWGKIQRPPQAKFFMAEPNVEPFFPPGFGAHLGPLKEFSPVYRMRVEGTPTTESVLFPLCPGSPPLGRQNPARVKPYAARSKRAGDQRPKSVRLDLELRL